MSGVAGSVGATSAPEAVRAWMEAHPPEFRLSDTGPSMADWQHRLRERLWPLIGGRIDPGRDLPKPELDLGLPEVADGHTRRRITYATEPGIRAAAWLLTPSPDRRRPGAVLALHGHGPAGKDGPAAEDGFATDLARRGFLVLVPEARGFGERSDPSGAGCHITGVASLLLGRPIAAQRLWEDVAALTLLRALAGTHKLAAVGHSEGGRRALMLGALDERVAVTVVSGYFTSIRQEIALWQRLRGWDICNATPGLAAVADLPEVAALCLPRALCVDWGRADQLYTPEAVEQAVGQVSALYRREGLDGRLLTHGHDGGHHFGGAPVLDWVHQQLAR